jgi:hypothetical protein
MKNDTGKWCDLHKIPWHKTDESRSKQSMVVEVKDTEPNLDLEYDLENIENRQIIDTEPTSTLYIFHANMGIKDSKQHLVLKYHGALHRYIQTEMDFLNISSLGDSYRYALKIKQKFRHENKWELGLQI